MASVEYKALVDSQIKLRSESVRLNAFNGTQGAPLSGTVASARAVLGWIVSDGNKWQVVHT